MSTTDPYAWDWVLQFHVGDKVCRDRSAKGKDGSHHNNRHLEEVDDNKDNDGNDGDYNENEQKDDDIVEYLIIKGVAAVSIHGSKDQEEISVSDTAYKLTSVANQKFVKVERQNLIVKQKEMSFSVIGF